MKNTVSRIFRLWAFLCAGMFLSVLPWQVMGQTTASAAGKPALYEFGAGFCASCKDMEKIIKELTGTHGNQVEFRLVYSDKEKDLFQQYKIMLIPTQVFLDASGKEVDRHIGPLTKEEVLQKLKDLKLIK